MKNSKPLLALSLLVPLLFALMAVWGAGRVPAAEYPPQDHGGEALTLADGDVIWGAHTGLDEFEIPTTATVQVKAYDPATTGAGCVLIEARLIDISGVLDASGAGFTGGGGGRGYGGGVANLGTPGSPGSNGNGRYGHPEGPGDGPAAGNWIMPGGYNVPGGNDDVSPDANVWMGSGGGGGFGGAGGVQSNQFAPGAMGGGGGGAGGNGGGAVMLFAQEHLQVSGQILTAGNLGGNGGDGELGDYYLDPNQPQGIPYQYGGDGGDGGDSFVAGMSLGGLSERPPLSYSPPGDDGYDGGSGAGGGIILLCNGYDSLVVSGTLDALGSRGEVENSGSVKLFYNGVADYSGAIHSVRVLWHNLDGGVPPTPTLTPSPTPTPTPSPTPGGVLRVPADFATIQDAVDAAWGGDTVIVSPGRYYENIQLHGRDIVLRSEEPTNADVVEMTIIDGGGLDYVITFNGDEGPDFILEGFTINNGNGAVNGKLAEPLIRYNRVVGNRRTKHDFAAGLSACYGIIEYNYIADNINEWGSNEGGGVRLGNIVRYNIVVENQGVSGYGGGICCTKMVINNFIADNVAQKGAGIYACEEVHSNYIVNNRASNKGGGVYYRWGNTYNNIITSNTALLGGGIYCEDYDLSIVNNLILNNYSTESGGGIYGITGSHRNNIIWDNTSGDGKQIAESSIPSYSCIEDWPTTGPEIGIGNFSLDPQILDPDAGLFYLSDSSPCIDAGDPDPAFNDACRPPGQGTERGDVGPWGGPYNNQWKPLIDMDIKNTMLGKNPFLPELVPTWDWNKNGEIDVGDLIMMQHCQP